MTSDRIARATRETDRSDGEGPAFQLDGPAANLFADLHVLCGHVTLDLYYAVLGHRPDRGELSPVRPLPDHPAGKPAALSADVEPTGATDAASAPKTHPRPLPLRPPGDRRTGRPAGAPRTAGGTRRPGGADGGEAEESRRRLPPSTA